MGDSSEIILVELSFFAEGRRKASKQASYIGGKGGVKKQEGGGVEVAFESLEVSEEEEEEEVKDKDKEKEKRQNERPWEPSASWVGYRRTLQGRGWEWSLIGATHEAYGTPTSSWGMASPQPTFSAYPTWSAICRKQGISVSTVPVSTAIS